MPYIILEALADDLIMRVPVPGGDPTFRAFWVLDLGGGLYQLYNKRIIDAFDSIFGTILSPHRGGGSLKDTPHYLFLLSPENFVFVYGDEFLNVGQGEIEAKDFVHLPIWNYYLLRTSIPTNVRGQNGHVIKGDIVAFPDDRTLVKLAPGMKEIPR